MYVEYVSCSEVWTFAANKLWFLKKIFGIKQEFPKGIRRHDAVYDKSLLQELDAKDRERVERVTSLMERLGEVRPPRTFFKNPEESLMGKADGFLGDLPVEIKFYKASRADRLQATAYALLYGKPKTYLVNPYGVEEIAVEEHMEEVRILVEEIKSFKRLSKEDIQSLLEEVVF